ncbi:cell-cycle regulation histidine triad HIT protein [Anoxybacter fermentans]|uniref:Cell-cycle regulation histidine triad HIT protein n=1 Tax=Anoxybacter fermentans TaxID=1323375 RepID=A0A3S9SYW9_9FIRM|nr:HIT family protein [Anoxybacter fermentans]AZR73458.1 cell-cycle regulation histidine triad HIT protein [Anoxybacter fermentans]
MKECPFCFPEIDQEQKIVLTNEHCMFLQKPQQVLIGSGVIVPRKHRETVFDLTPEEWNSIYDLLIEVKEYLDKKYNPQGYNVGWNVGRVGGQEIFHAHLHVIPRYEDEPLAGKGIRFWLKQPENKRNNID